MPLLPRVARQDKMDDKYNISESSTIDIAGIDDDWYAGPPDFTPWQFTLSLSITSIVAGITGVTSLLLLASILRYKETRSKSFNLYLLAVIFPDALYGVACSLTCSLNLAHGRVHSWGGCVWQAWYFQFYVIANMWMNSAIAHQILKMLRYSDQRRRYFPPNRRTVVLQVVGIYTLATLSPLLRMLVPSFHNEVKNHIGSCSLESDGTTVGTLSHLLLFLVLGLFLPFVYMMYICYTVYARKLLPPSGKSRYLAFYFFRIGAIFVAFNIALIVVMFVPGWAGFAASVWTHFQGIVTFFFVIEKHDVKRAVKSFLCCRRDMETVESSKKATVITTTATCGAEAVLAADDTPSQVQKPIV